MSLGADEEKKCKLLYIGFIKFCDTRVIFLYLFLHFYTLILLTSSINSLISLWV